MTYDEYIGLFGLETYKSDKKRNNITIHGIGGNGRKVFVEYESLKDNRKDAVKKKYGNPYEYLAKQPVLDLIDWDYEAQNFYNNYVLDNGMKLPNSSEDAKGKPQINYVERYTKAVNWLNMISRLTSDKKALKSALNLSVMGFWDTVSDLILKEGIAIPANPKRLKGKLKEYQEQRTNEDKYKLLIESHRFGNGNAKKIADETAEALLTKMLADPRKYDDNYIAVSYNKWAKANNRAEVTAGAVGYFRRNNEHIIAPMREGKKPTYNKYVKHIQRERTKTPLAFINADDNDLDLYFKVESYQDGKRKVSNFYRPKLYVIIDTFNDYILGYAIGDQVTHELIFEAFRNMINHIKELTGGYYLPHQLQTDNWGLDVKKKNDLATFFKSIGHYTAQSHGVAQSKYIERSFGHAWHQILKLMPNYAGHNVKAKTSISPEHFAEVAKTFPSVEQMPEIVAKLIDVMRRKVDEKTGKSRQEQWLEAFNTQPRSSEKAIDSAVKLQLFGKKHGYSLKIAASGLRPTLGGVTTSYDIPDEIIWQHNGKKVECYYDPSDLSEVLFTDSKGLRFVAKEYEKLPSALIDQQEGDRNRLNTLLAAKKAIGEQMGNVLAEKLNLLERERIDADSILQAGVMTKAIAHNAVAIAGGYTVEAPKKAINQIENAETDEFNIYDLY